MMSSGSSTDRGQTGRAIGIQVWHFYLLLSLAAATVAVIRSPHTEPAALLLLSAAIFAAGFVALAAHRAIVGLLTPHEMHARAPLAAGTREALEIDKAIVLRSIKELEFDKAMGKVDDADFADIGGRLRARAMDLIRELDRTPADAAAPAEEVRADVAPVAAVCPSCGLAVDADARFCKNCGARVA